ncbi:hypothetical protein GC175_27240 [bacterium]|nr:hypothetical protein [bacterium]
MSYAPNEVRQSEEVRRSRGRGWLQLIFLLGFFASVLIGLMALIGLYVLNQAPQSVSVVSEQRALIQPSQIPPHLALLQLTGADPDALAKQATNARESALGYALIQYDDSLAASQRAADMLRLGSQFVDAGQTPQAIDAYRTARTVAILAPELAPLERGQILTQAAVGLVAAGAVEAAVDTARQAQHLAIQLPNLLPAQRVQILDAVAPVLRAHGSEEAARQISELLRNPAIGRRNIALISQWTQLPEPVSVDTPLLDVVAQRQAAVQALTDRLLLTGGQDFDAERALVRSLLQEEDDLRAQRYTRINESGLTLGRQHTLIQEQRNWILLKLRIGQGGFGVDLAPDWGAQADALRLSLNQVTNNLVTVLNAQIAAESDPLVAAMLRAEVLQRLILYSELGFYPNAPLGELTTQLESAQTELERLGAPPALPIFYDVNAAEPGFRIAQRY